MKKAIAVGISVALSTTFLFAEVNSTSNNSQYPKSEAVKGDFNEIVKNLRQIEKEFEKLETAQKEQKIPLQERISKKIADTKALMKLEFFNKELNNTKILKPRLKALEKLVRYSYMLDKKYREMVIPFISKYSYGKDIIYVIDSKFYEELKQKTKTKLYYKTFLYQIRNALKESNPARLYEDYKAISAYAKSYLAPYALLYPSYLEPPKLVGMKESRNFYVPRVDSFVSGGFPSPRAIPPGMPRGVAQQPSSSVPSMPTQGGMTEPKRYTEVFAKDLKRYAHIEDRDTYIIARW